MTSLQNKGYREMWGEGATEGDEYHGRLKQKQKQTTTVK